MTLSHYAGALLVLLLITALGWHSGSRVKTAGDFVSGGRRAGAGIVAGTIMGTLVGGASTIGTAQLAFNFGFSAWWFTLGGGIACLFLGFVYAKPLYESGAFTLPQVVQREYGQRTATAAALLTSMGNFLSVVAQILSSVALVTSVSSMPVSLVVFLTVVLMLFYVVFGGIWGTGIVGIAKMTLLGVSVGLCGLAALHWQGGFGEFMKVLPPERFFNMVTRGPAKDIGACVSMILGVLSTQAYIQAIISARSLRLARTGAVVSALLVPLVGACGIMVGLYMRVHFPDINPGSALPLFVLTYVPPVFAGMILATLLVTVVGTAAGVSLGLASVLCNDIYCVHISKNSTDSKRLAVSRLLLAGILAVAGLISLLNPGSMILNWSILSMALRGVAGFGVFTAALFLPGRIGPAYAFWSIFIGLFCVLAGRPLVGHFMDPLFLGLAAGALVLLAGYGRGMEK